MIEIVWRHDPSAGVAERPPATAAEARARLEAGSAAFAALVNEGGRQVHTLPAHAFGLPTGPDGEIAQEPFAAVLGCSDARAPIELILGQAVNDLFIVRVAGNVPGTECLGSLDFAVSHLASMRLLVVLGHTGCGAVTAAVDAYLAPETYFEIADDPELRAVVDAIMGAVTTAADALSDAPGPGVGDPSERRATLVETAVIVHAAFTASHILGRSRSGRSGRLGVAFGVYDLARRSVGLPRSGGWTAGLFDPPGDAAALRDLAVEVAAALAR
jgi:carbonic anhydrase